jgi:hypothetical protein
MAAQPLRLESLTMRNLPLFDDQPCRPAVLIWQVVDGTKRLLASTESPQGDTRFHFALFLP